MRTAPKSTSFTHSPKFTVVHDTERFAAMLPKRYTSRPDRHKKKKKPTHCQQKQGYNDATNNPTSVAHLRVRHGLMSDASSRQEKRNKKKMTQLKQQLYKNIYKNIKKPVVSKQRTMTRRG